MPGRNFTFTSAAVDVANNCIDFAGNVPPVGVAVTFAGTPPGGIAAFPAMYWVRNYLEGGVPHATKRVLNVGYNSDDRPDLWMANITSTGSGTMAMTEVAYTVQSGPWDTASTWINGVPVDGDHVVINAGHEILVDCDQSAWTGMRDILMDHNEAGNPPMLYWTNGQDGHLKVRSGPLGQDPYSIRTVTYNGIAWNTEGKRARILINANGDWNSISPLGAQYSAVIELVSDNTQSSARIDGSLIEFRIYDSDPGVKFVEVYGERYDFVAGPATVDLTQDYWALDLGVTPPPPGTQVMLRSLGGTLPAPLESGVPYVIYETDGTWVRLAASGGLLWTDLVRLTDTGSGQVSLYTGVGPDEATVNTWQDVSADTEWRTSGADDVMLTNLRQGVEFRNGFPTAQNYFYQTKLASKGAFSLTTESAHPWTLLAPGGRVWLMRRNVRIVGTGGYGYGTMVGMDARCPHPDTYIRCMAGFTLPEDGYRGQTGTIIAGAIGSRIDAFLVNGAVGAYLVDCESNCTCVGCVAGVFLDAGASGSMTIAGCGVGLTGYRYHSLTNAVDVTAEVVGCEAGIDDMNAHGYSIRGEIVGCDVGVGLAHQSFVYSTVIGCRAGLSGAEQVSFLGAIYNCEVAVTESPGASVSGAIARCWRAFAGDFQFNVSGLSISRCTYVFDGVSGTVICNGLSISDCFVEYNAGQATGYWFKNIRSYNHNTVPKAMHVWGPSGTITHHLGANIPPGLTYAHMFTFSATGTAPVWTEWDLMNFSETTLQLVVYAKNYPTTYNGALDMYGGQLVQWAIVDAGNDPWLNPAAAYIDYWASSGATKEWQSHTLSCTRTGEQPLKLRVWAMRDSNVAAYANCYLVGAGGITYGIVGVNM